MRLYDSVTGKLLADGKFKMTRIKGCTMEESGDFAFFVISYDGEGAILPIPPAQPLRPTFSIITEINKKDCTAECSTIYGESRQTLKIKLTGEEWETLYCYLLTKLLEIK